MERGKSLTGLEGDESPSGRKRRESEVREERGHIQRGAPASRSSVLVRDFLAYMPGVGLRDVHVALHQVCRWEWRLASYLGRYEGTATPP